MLANRASTGANFRKVFARRFILYQNVNKRRIQRFHTCTFTGRASIKSVNSSHRTNVPGKVFMT